MKPQDDYQDAYDDHRQVAFHRAQQHPVQKFLAGAQAFRNLHDYTSPLFAYSGGSIGRASAATRTGVPR